MRNLGPLRNDVLRSFDVIAIRRSVSRREGCRRENMSECARKRKPKSVHELRRNTLRLGEGSYGKTEVKIRQTDIVDEASECLLNASVKNVSASGTKITSHGLGACAWVAISSDRHFFI